MPNILIPCIDDDSTPRYISSAPPVSINSFLYFLFLSLPPKSSPSSPVSFPFRYLCSSFFQFPYPPTSRLRRINQNHNSANQDILYKKRHPSDPNPLPQQSVDQKPPSTTSISLAPLSLNCSALHLNIQQLTQHSELPLSLPPIDLDDISISIQFNLHHS
ncbi:hypothetical protein PGT21_032635 [Puccinia graminis f. sp. tritici]|uniref:Uncharacterized protein n=1 Tax=Puccinia graminis f. sp. tritici TaxID=56615 RepID=A0A5B0QJX8_PUCGR|nr:hypothetical protein PGT21_032635 [Puccinia graminis f. sp. tritici]